MMSRALLTTRLASLLFVACSATTLLLVLARSSHGLKYNSIARYYSAYRRRCLEKSLEAREASADAVFTGTIRDLMEDQHNPRTKASTHHFIL